MTAIKSPSDETIVLSLNFNQDGECFVCGVDDGFRIFNSNPLKQIQREYLDGGIKFAEMLFRCNYLALVGGGVKSAFPTNKVVIWDCSLRKSVIELEMKSDVRVVRLRRDRIVVVLQSSIHVFSFSDIPVQLYEFKTPDNPLGLCALSPSVENSCLAFPSLGAIGSIEIEGVNSCRREENARSLRIKAHSHAVQVLAFNTSGTVIASASLKGTLVRLFDTSKGTLLKEFRRGSNPAKISCINFSLDSRLICVSSNHSTIHVFEYNKLSTKNLRLKKVERYLKGDVSFSRLRAPTTNKSTGICQCAFDKNSDALIALGTDGSYFNFQFDKNTGACNQQNYCLFVELNNDK